jgi:hypothetical protein
MKPKSHLSLQGKQNGDLSDSQEVRCSENYKGQRCLMRPGVLSWSAEGRRIWKSSLIRLLHPESLKNDLPPWRLCHHIFGLKGDVMPRPGGLTLTVFSQLQESFST